MGKLKSRNIKVSIVSGGLAVLNGIWIRYAAVTTAASVPADYKAVRTMMADPPMELPWLLAVLCVIILAWSFWPSKGSDSMPDNDDDEKGSGGGSQSTGGDNSPNLQGTFHGPVNVNTTPPAPQASTGMIDGCEVGEIEWNRNEVHKGFDSDKFKFVSGNAKIGRIIVNDSWFGGPGDKSAKDDKSK